MSDFVEIVVKQRETAAKAEREKIMREQPAPPAGGGSAADDAFGDKFKQALGLR